MNNCRNMLRFAALALGLSMGLSLALAAAPCPTASAQEITFAEPVHRPLYFGGGVGVSAGLDGGPALFKIQEEIGYQMDPIWLGSVDLALRFGGDFAQLVGDFTILEFDGRVTASFGLWHGDGIGIRVAPSVALGGAVLFLRYCDVFGCGDASYGAFDFQFATQAELELLEGLLTIWFRPIAIDGLFRDNSSARWDILAGVDVHL